MLDSIDVKYFRFAVGSDIGKETPNDISARCIICGDSEKDIRQKRLHLYQKSSYDSPAVHCFNCEFSGNMHSFLRETNSVLFEQYKKEKRETSFNAMKQKHVEKETDEIIDIGYTYKKKQVYNFEFPKEFIPASDSEEAKVYINGRSLSTKGVFYSPVDISVGDKYLPIKDSIIIPLWYKRDQNLVYGFQARKIKEKRFYTFIPEQNTGYKVWNWFEIDKTQPTFIFESVFDAMSSGLPRNRIVAALGADLNDDRISELKEAIFCLDNQHKDRTSKIKSTELLQNGYRVFVWPTDIQQKDSNSWLQETNPEKSFAHIILSNLMVGNKGVLKLKLSK